MHPLKMAIYKKGFTIREFSEKSGINRTTFYKIFCGQTRDVRPDTIYKISECLNEPYEKIVSMVVGL